MKKVPRHEAMAVSVIVRHIFGPDFTFFFGGGGDSQRTDRTDNTHTDLGSVGCLLFVVFHSLRRTKRSVRVIIFDNGLAPWVCCVLIFLVDKKNRYLFIQ